MTPENYSDGSSASKVNKTTNIGGLEFIADAMEDLSGMGLTAADLAEGGRAAVRWGEISNVLLDRAVKGMKIHR